MAKIIRARKKANSLAPEGTFVPGPVEMDDKIPSFEQALDGKYEETYGQARADRRALGPFEKIGA
jgi:hypothetical protein